MEDQFLLLHNGHFVTRMVQALIVSSALTSENLILLTPRIIRLSVTMGSYPRHHITVGIVGGGIAGLALARMLELSGISYCLWEAYSQFAPPAGASVGLMPNGLRILDQLQMIDKINEYNVKRKVWEHRDGNGSLQASVNPGAVIEEKY